MTGVRRAIVLSTADRYFALAGNFLTLAVVSRLMTPSELGVAVVGLAIVGLVGTVREFAGTNFVIQRPDLTHNQVRAAFTLALGSTLIVSIGLFCLAPVAGRIYDDDRLVPYLQVVCAALLLETLGQFACTLMRREMRFGTLAIISVIGTTTSFSVVVVLATLGFSYMSFAWAWVATALVVAVLTTAVRRDLSIFKPHFGEWRHLIAFGGYNGGTVLAYKIFESVPYLLLGRILTLDAAALFHRGIMLCQIPDKVFLAGAANVVLPAFSVEVREGRQLKRSYLRALELLTVLQWPALLVLAALAYPVVDILLGDQWHAVAPLVQVIALAWLFSFSFELNYPVLVSVGAIRDVFLRAVIVFPVSAVIIACAALFGLKAVAWSMLLAVSFQAYVGMSFVRRRLDLSWSELAGSVRSSAIVALLTVAGPLIVTLTATPIFQPSLALSLVSAGVAVLAWFAALRLVRHPMLDEIAATLPARLRLPTGRKPVALPVGD